MLPMTTSKVKTISSPGGDLLRGRHLATTHCVQCGPGPSIERARGVAQLHLRTTKESIRFLFCFPVVSFVLNCFVCTWLCHRFLRCLREATEGRRAWTAKRDLVG